jgi:purple acid phosphatase-like protein
VNGGEYLKHIRSASRNPDRGRSEHATLLRQHGLRHRRWKHFLRNRLLLVLAAGLLLSWSTATQVSRVHITEGPALELFRDNEAIIRWTSNNPGGTDEHFGFVKYGTDPNNLNLTAKSHIRLNQNHPYTVFRVRLEDIKPGTTYYYTVDSMEATGELDGVKSTVYHFTARE